MSHGEDDDGRHPGCPEHLAYAPSQTDGEPGGPSHDDREPGGPSHDDREPDGRPIPEHRRRGVVVALGAVAALVLAANLAPRGPAPSPDPGSTADAAVATAPLDVCEAVAFANQTGGLPSKPTVLPPRAGGYFAFTDRGNRATVVAGLTYLDGTVALCRPVADPGDGSPKPDQPELPALDDDRTHAYEVGSAGLALIGERTADGTIIRSTAAG